MSLLFTISLKILQQNILETSLTAKVIVSIIFSIKNLVFLKINYVIIMSEDTPECAKLQIKKKFHGIMVIDSTPEQCVPRPGDLKFPQK